MSAEVNVDVEDASLEANVQANETEAHNDVSKEAKESEQRKRNDAEFNWAEMRRQSERDRQELANLKAELNQLKKAPQHEEDELATLAKDDILTVGQAEKLYEKRARKIAEDVIRQREAATFDDRIQLKFPDYKDVVTVDSIELLKQNEPELALSLSHMPDPYSQAVAAYKLLKKLTPAPSSSPEKKKALENSQKPVSVNAVTKQSAIGNAHLFENGLTPELKSSLWKEMQQSMKAG